ncbi:MAG: sulfatase [Bacteroidetes bacterium]|nr:sulfatase [Bacteroidota bacterium]
MKTLYPLLSIIFVFPLYLIGQTNPSRPNIIFILTDDQRWDALSAAGNPIIQTPEMDKLAQTGFHFTNAFVTTPICAASRASIITGMEERTHQFTFGTPPLASVCTATSYPVLMKRNGYHTGFIGKFGMNWESDPKEIFDMYDPLNQNGYFTLTGPGASIHTHLTDRIGEKAIDYIKARNQEQPFCLSISFHAPHADDANPNQYVWPARMDSLYQDINIPEARMSEQTWFDAQPEYVRNGLNYLRWKWRYDTPEKYQRMVKGYYRMISTIDENIGKIRQALDETGHADNTIIILMGDNGYFIGERGFAGKWLMYEQSLRVPLVIYDPGMESGDRQISELALNIDIPATILDLAGIGIPGAQQGRSLLPLMKGLNIRWRDYFFCEHLFDHDFIPQSEGIRSTRYKYFRYRDDPDHEELYDLRKDPWEAENLAGRKKYSRKLIELRSLCDLEIKYATQMRQH